MTRLQCRQEARQKREKWYRYALIIAILLMLAVTARNVSAILLNGNNHSQQQGGGMSITVRPPEEEEPGAGEAELQLEATAEEEDSPVPLSEEDATLRDVDATETALASATDPETEGNPEALQQATLISNVLTASITASILEAEVEIRPRTINLRVPPEADLLRAYIELEDYEPEDGDWEYVHFNYEEEKVEADGGRIVGNRLMVEFPWEDVADILEVGEDVEVLITGEINDIPYRGSDTIRVVDTPPDVPPVTPPGPPAAAPPGPASPEEEIVVEPEPPAAVAEEQILIIVQIDSERAYVSGEEFLLDVAPFIEPAIDRTLVSVRFVGEKLGASVDWLPETRQVRVKDEDEDVDILLTINSDTALVNGEPVRLEWPAEIENDRTIAPLRFVSENLGARVTWDGDTRMITIVK